MYLYHTLQSNSGKTKWFKIGFCFALFLLNKDLSQQMLFVCWVSALYSNTTQSDDCSSSPLEGAADQPPPAGCWRPARPVRPVNSCTPSHTHRQSFDCLVDYLSVFRFMFDRGLVWSEHICVEIWRRCFLTMMDLQITLRKASNY